MAARSAAETAGANSKSILATCSGRTSSPYVVHFALCRLRSSGQWPDGQFTASLVVPILGRVRCTASVAGDCRYLRDIG